MAERAREACRKCGSEGTYKEGDYDSLCWACARVDALEERIDELWRALREHEAKEPSEHEFVVTGASPAPTDSAETEGDRAAEFEAFQRGWWASAASGVDKLTLDQSRAPA